jgi:hypothetical protein
MTNRPVISIVALGFSILALGVSTTALESVRKTPATRCALSVGDIIRRHDGKSYIVCKVWFNEKTGHWIADESPLAAGELGLDRDFHSFAGQQRIGEPFST